MRLPEGGGWDITVEVVAERPELVEVEVSAETHGLEIYISPYLRGKSV